MLKSVLVKCKICNFETQKPLSPVHLIVVKKSAVMFFIIIIINSVSLHYDETIVYITTLSGNIVFNVKFQVCVI